MHFLGPPADLERDKRDAGRTYLMQIHHHNPMKDFCMYSDVDRFGPSCVCYDSDTTTTVSNEAQQEGAVV